MAFIRGSDEPSFSLHKKYVLGEEVIKGVYTLKDHAYILQL